MIRRYMAPALAAAMLLAAPAAFARAPMPANPLTNAQVRQAQMQLKDMGLYKGKIDGLYGHWTIAAVGKFQKEKGLPQTRALTKGTLQKIASVAQSTMQKQPAGQSQGSAAKAAAPANAGASMPMTSSPSTTSAPSPATTTK